MLFKSLQIDTDFTKIDHYPSNILKERKYVTTNSQLITQIATDKKYLLQVLMKMLICKMELLITW